MRKVFIDEASGGEKESEVQMLKLRKRSKGSLDVSLRQRINNGVD